MDGQAFGAEIVEIVKGYVDKAVSPLLTRLESLEERVKAIPAPVDLSDDLAALKSAVEAIVIPELPELPEIKLPDIPALVEDAVKAIPAPQDGKSVTLDDVAPLIAAEVEKRVSELPSPKDGRDGIDGVGLAGALIDRDGNLVVTLTNGEAKNLGPIVGKDGEPGEPGKDGFSLKEFGVDLLDDGRTIRLKFEDRSDDAVSVDLPIPAMIYRGVFKEGEPYAKGDTVTWGGSLWHCDENTAEKPDTASKAWTLAAKRGRDGKDGIVKTVNDKPIVSVGVRKDSANG